MAVGTVLIGYILILCADLNVCMEAEYLDPINKYVWVEYIYISYIIFYFL